jgi:hypothetical protein
VKPRADEREGNTNAHARGGAQHLEQEDRCTRQPDGFTSETPSILEMA